MSKEYNFPPKEDCKYCKGTGMKPVSKLDTEVVCICRFVEHEFCEELGEMLAYTARKIRKEMFGD